MWVLPYSSVVRERKAKKKKIEPKLLTKVVSNLTGESSLSVQRYERIKE